MLRVRLHAMRRNRRFEEASPNEEEPAHAGAVPEPHVAIWQTTVEVLQLHGLRAVLAMAISHMLPLRLRLRLWRRDGDGR